MPTKAGDVKGWFEMTLSEVGIAVLSAIYLQTMASGEAWADNTALYVKNNTSGYITVNVDGNYGCNTSSGPTCSIPVTVGDHDLDATRSDTGERVTRSQYISSKGFTWEPW